jgi:hypothetical protein
MEVCGGGVVGFFAFVIQVRSSGASAWEGKKAPWV